MAFATPKTPPPPPPKPCAKCGGESCWTIWGHRVCVACANAWDALNINADFQKATDEWVKGKP